MSATVKPVPEGHEGAIPYLCANNASEAIAFYKNAFGAVEALCIAHEGKVGHAELEIGRARGVPPPYLAARVQPEDCKISLPQTPTTR